MELMNIIKETLWKIWKEVFQTLPILITNLSLLSPGSKADNLNTQGESHRIVTYLNLILYVYLFN